MSIPTIASFTVTTTEARGPGPVTVATGIKIAPGQALLLCVHGIDTGGGADANVTEVKHNGNVMSEVDEASLIATDTTPFTIATAGTGDITVEWDQAVSVTCISIILIDRANTASIINVFKAENDEDTAAPSVDIVTNKPKTLVLAFGTYRDQGGEGRITGISSGDLLLYNQPGMSLQIAFCIRTNAAAAGTFTSAAITTGFTGGDEDCVWLVLAINEGPGALSTHTKVKPALKTRFKVAA